jgi:ATP phosphoribosyltransferase
MYGSVESAIAIGYSDYICDLVSSGKTLIENELYENIAIKDIYPVIIQNINEVEVI